VAYYVQRNAPGRRFGDVRIGLWWRESDAAEFADDIHALKHLIDADAAETYAAAREAAARTEERERLCKRIELEASLCAEGGATRVTLQSLAGCIRVESGDAIRAG
jgi:hypothetical protein